MPKNLENRPPHSCLFLTGNISEKPLCFSLHGWRCSTRRKEWVFFIFFKIIIAHCALPNVCPHRNLLQQILPASFHEASFPMRMGHQLLCASCKSVYAVSISHEMAMYPLFFQEEIWVTNFPPLKPAEKDTLVCLHTGLPKHFSAIWLWALKLVHNALSLSACHSDKTHCGFSSINHIEETLFLASLGTQETTKFVVSCVFLGDLFKLTFGSKSSVANFVKNHPMHIIFEGSELRKHHILFCVAR